MLVRLAGVAAIVGASLWAWKAVSILASGVQPPWAFELAPPFLAMGLFGLASDSSAARPGKVVVATVALVALSSAALAAVFDVSDALFGALLGIGSLLLVAGLVWVGWDRRSHDWLPLALGLGTIPLMAFGGLLALGSERLLEVPLLVIALAWGALGVGLLRQEA